MSSGTDSTGFGQRNWTAAVASVTEVGRMFLRDILLPWESCRAMILSTGRSSRDADVARGLAHAVNTTTHGRHGGVRLTFTCDPCSAQTQRAEAFV